MANSRETYNLKKIQKFNKIDQTQNKDTIKEIIFKQEKNLIDEKISDIKKLISEKELQSKKDLAECIKNRTNQPYKGIIKNFDYNRKFEKSEDLIVHKVSNEDKKDFFKDVEKYTTEKEKQNKEIDNTYSKDKKNEHKKEFEYQHKYKFRAKIDDNVDADLRVDRIEFYKKEQEKMENSKKKIDDILINLIDSGILSENMDTINYDKLMLKIWKKL
jgi:hypothetical protein